MISSPSVSVAIPVLDEELHIDACLDAIDAQTYGNIVEVLIVDGGSKDRTRELAAAHPRVRVLRNPRRIQAAALNIALDAAKGEVFVRVDGHCIVADDYVERCVDALERTGAAVVGGGMTPIPADAPMPVAIGAAMSSPLAVGPARFHAGGESGWVDTVYLGAYNVARARTIGGYAEDVGVNEDAEFAFRMKSCGGIWFDPSIRSQYAPRSSLTAVAKQFRKYGWSRAHTVVRHPESIRPRQLAPIALVVLLLLPRTRRPVAIAYAATLGVGAIRAGQRTPRDAARFAAVAATMHLTWAAGFFAGIVRALRSR